MATNAMSFATMPNRSEAQAMPRSTCEEATAWVQPFVREHCLELGAMAWQGLRQWGRGLVLCAAALPCGRAIHWTTEIVPNRLGYWSSAAVADRLEALQLGDLDHGLLHHALATYAPRTELVVLMLGSAQPVTLHLRQMRITPAECDRQLQRRHREFCSAG